MMEWLQWPLITMGIIFAVYTLCRVGSSAVFKSWFETKKEFENDKENKL